MLSFVLTASLFSVPTGFSSVNTAHQPVSGMVCSQPPAGLVDWQALAIQSLGAEVVRNPRAELLRTNHNEIGVDSLLKFEAPVTPALKERHWSLVYESGMMDFTPHILKGTAAWVVDNNFSIVGGPSFYGDMCSRIALSRAQAAFILEGPAGAWAVQPATAVTFGRIKYSFRWNGREYPIERPDFLGGPRTGNEKTINVGQARVMRGDSGTLLALIIWDKRAMCGDRCCENVYSLFELTPDGEARRALDSAYNCDV